jgi:hypothetical protein
MTNGSVSTLRKGRLRQPLESGLANGLTFNDALWLRQGRGEVSERERLDAALAPGIAAPTREQIWASAQRILEHQVIRGDEDANTGLALGYVQSGKTTSITALTALAADIGYQVVVALLGSTNLLLDQNRERLEAALGIATRNDYVWISETNPVTEAAGKRLLDFLGRPRVCLVPVLKNAGRISAVAKQMQKLPPDTRVLIIDDEADQGSLNTSQQAESKTYAAIKELRSVFPEHLYVQYTATPYAPLLLDSADILSPRFVEFLAPGSGYTGGKEFFIDNATTVVRNVPMLDEQASKTPPLQLQTSLVQALASFLAGAALLLYHDRSSPPISMLVHSTARNDVQSRYEFLIDRQLSKWREALDTDDVAAIPDMIAKERVRLVGHGVEDVPDPVFITHLNEVLREATIWLVNSAAAVNRVDWHVAPIHILIGGNKLDRGFTVEGLTVTYMNRPASPQVDTLEQRARAFGYRGDLLPYCQFFGSVRTVKSLTEIVQTEEDLRARLRDEIEAGGSVRSWSEEIGLLLPGGMKPTRTSVVQALSTQALGWHSQRKPALAAADTEFNGGLLRDLGLVDAAFEDFGRLRFRALHLSNLEHLMAALSQWRRSPYSPGWLHEEFLAAIERKFEALHAATVMLMEQEDGTPRIRRWEPDIGFVNLFQGHDQKPQLDGSAYPGDRDVLDIQNNPDQIVIQVHRVVPRDQSDEVLALAFYLGSGSIVTTGGT